MTEDKEIIIDGINVAGCEFLLENNNLKTKDCECINHIYERMNSSATVHSECKDNPDYSYKQLKRLEQENKKLKEENTLLKEELLKKSETEQSFQSLLDENKELKEYCTCDTERYFSALEEIKSVCKDENDMCAGECGNFNVAQQVLDILRKLERFKK